MRWIPDFLYSQHREDELLKLCYKFQSWRKRESDEMMAADEKEQMQPPFIRKKLYLLIIQGKEIKIILWIILYMNCIGYRNI